MNYTEESNQIGEIDKPRLVSKINWSKIKKSFEKVMLNSYIDKKPMLSNEIFEWFKTEINKQK